MEHLPKYWRNIPNPFIVVILIFCCHKTLKSHAANFKLKFGIFVPKVYECEQAECPQRALRLTAAHTSSDGKHQQQRTSRSLVELTGDKEVFSW
jgi:hypothetical protein